ncbi:UDP-N-acetylmuramate dehydrogenase [Sphingobacterium sp. UT-1RO-CII-1]|uniref:UDP-N-acetylmuramate dehydrogenase n=1 Tax=Sphingobacterium sp. UT-1RO-CII-1 TaxID=2995225 RepID=UPI00227B9154|nr:UDP-N-acetylmuramate dehydrogenase [Sphingobacterium sp. UT-1RO-CII-1]MCY4780669.1 UDP-N-acetylmuramate dehydrogenase [Sphingobacterium sp. UT-1RO-CII-1]
MTKHIHQNASLKAYNTFGVDASCNKLIHIYSENELPNIYEQGYFDQNTFILGGGSNVLFTKDYPGTILKVDNKGISHFIEGNYIYITAKAGEIWNDFVWYCIDRGFGGVENMALIPGTVGASPIQNIGAYGTELMDVFYSCQAFDTHTGSFTSFSKDDCKFTYRDSIFKTEYKGRYVITAVTYKLSLQHKINTSYGAINTELSRKGINNPTIKEVAEAVSTIRVEKLPDPSTIGNAGSFFKNPIIATDFLQSLKEKFPDIIYYIVDDRKVKLAAGWLIEQCGWKGKRDGNAAVWKNQALVLTNTGEASGTEIYNLSSKIMNDVYQKFNVKLEREVNVL